MPSKWVTHVWSRPFSWADLWDWTAAPFLTKGLQKEKHLDYCYVIARVRRCVPFGIKNVHRVFGITSAPTMVSTAQLLKYCHFSEVSLKAEWTPTEQVSVTSQTGIFFYLFFLMGDLLNHCCYSIPHGFVKAVLGMNTGRQRSPDSPAGFWRLHFCSHWKDGHATLQLCQALASKGLEIIHVIP